MSKKLKLLLVDDHHLLRKGIEMLLRFLYKEIEIYEVEDGQDAFEKLKSESFDVVILDLNLPKLDGFSVLRKVRLDDLKHNIIVLSLNEDKNSICKTFELGALCFLNKNTSSEELFKAIEKAKQGEKYYTDTTAKVILGEKEKIEKKNFVLNVLSKREMEIFKLVIQDFSNEMISKKLNISVRTVEGHRSNFRNKLGLKTRNSLIRFAIENNF